ncbi:MAG: GTPase Era [Defluviitaleaceae bacterium]|nr:GTPase Era [Defluviitaleaceae bacterium]
MNKSFKSGFITIIGKPNVGKSTLMNALIGEKIAIVTNKPQTTRNKIRCILTEEEFQAVFIDTPGIHDPKTKLGNFMVGSSISAFSEADIILYLVEPTEKISKIDMSIIERLKNIKANIFLSINKIDKIERSELLSIIDKYQELFEFKEIIPISAAKRDGLENLTETIKQYLPIGPKYFPDDMLTDQPERQIAAEIIREKSLMLLQEEIPHGIAVEIMSMKQRPGKDIVDVEATIYCEKDSHKGMVIGKGGEMLKSIGSRSRADMERLLGSKIFLEIWVKVKKDWRNSDFLLKNFGYKK